MPYNTVFNRIIVIVQLSCVWVQPGPSGLDSGLGLEYVVCTD